MKQDQHRYLLLLVSYAIRIKKEKKKKYPTTGQCTVNESEILEYSALNGRPPSNLFLQSSGNPSEEDYKSQRR